MKYEKDQDGWYTIPAAAPYMTMKTRLCPTDATTIETWAKSLIQKGQDAIDHGFGLCHDGSEYDLENFLADTLVGDVPWNDKDLKELYDMMHAQPNFAQVMTDFKNKYGRTYFELTWDEEVYAMNNPSVCD